MKAGVSGEMALAKLFFTPRDPILEFMSDDVKAYCTDPE